MAETQIIIRPQAGQADGREPVQPVLSAQPVQSVMPVQAGKSPAAVLAVQNTEAAQAGQVSAALPAEAQALSADTLLTKAVLQSPEDYVFQFAPETVVDKALIDDFRRFAFEQKMSLENARLMAKFYEAYVQGQSKKRSMEQAEFLKNMQKACEEDGEYGGLGFHDNMRYAKMAMLRFDDGSLAKILNETGFGSHPEVVRFMYRVGRALAEKDMPRAQNAKKEQSAAELFYPSMKK